MLEEHRWGLAIPVSQIACEGPSKTHLAWGAWGVPVEKLLYAWDEVATLSSLLILKISYMMIAPIPI
jgi:hypothetical protein